jgi:hypothetical protein
VRGLILQVGNAYDIIGLGTNPVAAEVMKRAGATKVAVGAKAIATTVPGADVILGTLNVILPGAMLGEITPEIAKAILSCRAKKILLPVNRFQVEVIGSEGQILDRLITQSLHRASSLVAEAASI